jgi:cellulose synthase/poly-beta-1,6-N-acetylglucosamine synthase-like glycosyltransferase
VGGLLWAGEAPLAVMAAYLQVLVAAAWLAPKRTPPALGEPRHRSLILVPAHDEEESLPRLLASLRRLDYPPGLYAVHVVADNCHDRTAEVAQLASVIVHERHDQQHLGKGYALRWLLAQCWESGEPCDAVVILDADSTVSLNFLRVADARLARGERVIQAYYSVQNPGRAWSIGLRYAALAAVHYMRPQGRMVLGGSAGLKGNGMVFASEILRQYPWPASLTEDIEYHLQLVLSGERVTFAPDAVVWAEMPDTLARARSQNVRWERGRLQMVRRYVPRLLRRAFADKSLLLLDAAIDQVIPPLSVVASGSLLSLCAALALDWLTRRARWLAGAGSAVGRAQIALGAGLVAAQASYVLSALALSGAPAVVYRSLVFAPVFVLWKGLVYVRILLGREQDGWVRTARNADGRGFSQSNIATGG